MSKKTVNFAFAFQAFNLKDLEVKPQKIKVKGKSQNRKVNSVVLKGHILCEKIT